MNDLFVYMIKVSIVFGVLYSFYRIFLHTMSFHTWNRFLLLFILLLSVICPVLDLNILNSDTFNTNNIWINDFGDFQGEGVTQHITARSNSLFQAQYVVLILYLLGVLVFLFRFIRQFRAILNSKKMSVRTIKDGSNLLIYSESIRTPFSFFKWIFLPVTIKSGEQSIIQHEKVHSSQLHSLDLILSEVYCILFWFNPFVFLFRKSLKTIHEFIADDQVLTSGKTTLEAYLRLLVSVTEMSTYGMTSNFKSLTIKKRINMITKNKSSIKHKTLYLLIIPVIALLIQSFSSIKESNDIPHLRPVNGGKITLKFGYCGEHPITKKPFTHQGVDIKIEKGTPVISTAGGVVVEAGDKGGWGNLVVIKHSDLYETRYSHLKEIRVKKGDKLNAGDVIGLSGNTGKSTGPHLHYEVIKNGDRVNPEEYFD